MLRATSKQKTSFDAEKPLPTIIYAVHQFSRSLTKDRKFATIVARVLLGTNQKPLLAIINGQSN